MTVDCSLNNVVKFGYCIGCGACAAIERSAYRITMDEFGKYQATTDIEEQDERSLVLASVCPFADKGSHEDEISRYLFGDRCDHDPRIGYYAATYAGHVSDSSFRQNGSSGGMGTWLAVELLRRGLVDAVVHVKGCSTHNRADPLFAMGLSRTEEEVCDGAKSRYYPIEMSGVLRHIRRTPGRYAVVGLPCFIKAVRRLALQESIFASRIPFCIGLVCGHLKSRCFSEMLAWQMGIPPGKLDTIDYRVKIPGKPASEYGVQATGETSHGPTSVVKCCNDLYGYDWGYGFFKYEACDYCDDVLAETADVAIGDAWLTQYVGDSEGTNVIVVRNADIRRFIEEGRTAGRLKLDDVSADTIAESQDGGLRHRREGLAYRLYLKDLAGQWRPHKRVKASNRLPRRRMAILRCRMNLTEQSHIAFQSARRTGDFNAFRGWMAPWIAKYSSLYRAPLWRRIVHRLVWMVRCRTK